MQKSVLEKVVLYVSILVGTFFLLSFNLQAQQLDMVILGDETSETEHGLDQLNTTVGLGGLNASYRKLEGDNLDSSYFGVTLSVDPNIQNYITIQLWGSDTIDRKKYLHLYFYETILGAIKKWSQIGGSGSDTPELANWSNVSTYPNRYVYVTYLLPDKVVQGQDTIHLRLTGAELPIYRAYTHTNSYFKPDENDIQGSTPAFNIKLLGWLKSHAFRREL